LVALGACMLCAITRYPHSPESALLVEYPE
jgi:hypothetical protein